MKPNHNASFSRPTYPPRRAFMVYLLTTPAAVDKSVLATLSAKQLNSVVKGGKNASIVTDHSTI